MITTSQTPADSASSAAARAFAIPELLENILVNLPPKEILATEHVDKTFHGFVKHLKETRDTFDVDRLEQRLQGKEVAGAMYPRSIGKIYLVEQQGVQRKWRSEMDFRASKVVVQAVYSGRSGIQ